MRFHVIGAFPLRWDGMAAMSRRPMRWVQGVVLGSLFALGSLAIAEVPPPPLLVTYLSQGAMSAVERAGKMGALQALHGVPGVVTVQVGRASTTAAVRARALSIELPDSGDTLVFDDLEVEVLEAGYVLYSPDEHASPSITVVVMGEDVVGTLHHDGAVYGVHALGDGLTAVYLDDAADHREHVERVDDFVIPPLMPRTSALLTQHDPEATKDRRDEIDVLVAYTGRVRRVAGSVAARIALLVFKTHRMYENSDISTRLNVVHSYQTPYDALAEHDELDNLEDLHRLRVPGDGFLDEALEKRKQFNADVVVLLYRTSNNRCGGGIAYQLEHRPGDDAWAFAASGVGIETCADYDARALAHEIGHVQGASHNPEEYNEPRGPYLYGHGFCNAAQNWRTVMAYNSGERCEPTIMHFSNPEVRYRGVRTGDVELRNVARLINETAFAVANFRQRHSGGREYTHRLPLVPGAGDSAGLQGFLRILNRSGVDGEVRIYAFDDRGEQFGPATFEIAAGFTGGFNSEDLEKGNASRGLRSGVGDGAGSWRLELVTDLDIEVHAYVRTAEGFLTSMDQSAREQEEFIVGTYVVPFFNPASNTSIRSLLRVANPNPVTVHVSIEAWDSHGQPGETRVEFSLRAGAAVRVSAQQLEAGDPAFTGRLGNGTGKWRLIVSARDGRPLDVMGLLATRSGHLTNLSR